MFGGFPGNFGGHFGTFENQYRCYSVAFIDKPHLEDGDKVILPPSALDRLASLRIDYPMLFEVWNDSAQKSSHCGVLEFIAEEGRIYMPSWVMENLLLGEGDLVRLKSATLAKGSYVKLQPHTSDFLDISNPKAVLEKTLRNFSCLTAGDTFRMNYNNKRYYIDVVESKPSQAICIIETDCEVDFAPPLDYVEPVYKKPEASTPVVSKPAAVPKETEVIEEEEPKFRAFVGGGNRLDGKAVEYQAPPPPRASSTGSSSSSASASPKKTAGKIVFGGPLRKPGEAKAPVAKQEPPKEETTEAPKFVAFQGKGNRLR